MHKIRKIFMFFEKSIINQRIKYYDLLLVITNFKLKTISAKIFNKGHSNFFQTEFNPKKFCSNTISMHQYKRYYPLEVFLASLICKKTI